MLPRKDQKQKELKKLAIMDQDGFNNKFLTLGNELVLTPRFNPTSQMVTYLSYFRNLPRVLSFGYRNRNARSCWRFSWNDLCAKIFPRWKKLL